MMRYVLVVLGGVLLSGVLSGIAGWVVARSTDMQGILSVAADRQAGQRVGEQRAEEFWRALERQSFRSRWIYCPGVTMVVGAFVGLFLRRHTWESALAAAAPFAILFSIGNQGVVSGLPLLGLYLGIAALTAWGVAAAIARARTSEAP